MSLSNVKDEIVREETMFQEAKSVKDQAKIQYF